LQQSMILQMISENNRLMHQLATHSTSVTQKSPVKCQSNNLAESIVITGSPTVTPQVQMASIFKSFKPFVIQNGSVTLDILIRNLLECKFAYVTDCATQDKSRIDKSVSYIKSKQSAESKAFFKKVPPSLNSTDYCAWSAQSNEYTRELCKEVKKLFEGTRVTNPTINSLHKLLPKSKI